MAKADSRKTLKEHSEAKVELFGRYLSIYLNVLSRANIDKIYLFDLFCGEGKYLDGGHGSPLVALETIKNHYFGNNNSCPQIEVIFNDVGESKIEPGKLKTERIEEFSKSIFRPPSVNVHYCNLDYSEILPSVIRTLNNLKKFERALLFIDPWGYKEIDPDDLKKITANGKAEVILFLPIYFMARFANKSIGDENFKGGQPLRNFMKKLFGRIEDVPYIENQQDLIYKLREQFKRFVEIKYVDAFRIERENNNWFCLYFFTSHKKGFQKMLESKWSIDPKRGSSFKLGDESALELFNELEISNYRNMLIRFLRERSGATNHELFDFGLENNFLPKHTKQILDNLKKEYNLNCASLDDKAVMGYYIGDSKRNVKITIN